MVLEIVKYGDPVLRTKGRKITEIDPGVRQLAADMLETMRAARGLGLAAQQVGAPLQLTIVDVAAVQQERPSTMTMDGQPMDIDQQMPLTLINPQLELGAERDVGSEGCLSFPEMSADIARASRVKVRAQTLDHGEIIFEATGLLARALQHEVDHLNGVLFIDRMNSATKAGLGGRLKRLQKEGAETASQHPKGPRAAKAKHPASGNQTKN